MIRVGLGGGMVFAEGVLRARMAVARARMAVSWTAMRGGGTVCAGQLRSRLGVSAFEWTIACGARVGMGRTL